MQAAPILVVLAAAAAADDDHQWVVAAYWDIVDVAKQQKALPQGPSLSSQHREIHGQ